MQKTILTIILSISTTINIYAQTTGILSELDSALHKIHTSTDSDTIRIDSVTIVDNSPTVELIKQSQNEDLTSSVKETILKEQLEALDKRDIRQRRIVMQQLQMLYHNDSLRRVEQKAQIDSLKQHAVGYPVTLKLDTLYYIYTNLGSVTPSERAKLNSEKILKAAKIFSLKTDSLVIVDGTNGTSDIMYGETILASITDVDGLWMETTREELTEDYKERIVEAIVVFKKNISLMNRLKTIGLTLLVIFGLLLAIKLVNHLFRKMVDIQLIAKKDIWFKGLKMKNLELMNSDRQMKAVLFVSKMIRYLLYISFVYISILLLFSIFPPTQRLAETLFGWIWSPIVTMIKNVIDYMPDLFRIIVIVVVIRYIVKFCRYIAREIHDERMVIPGFYPDWANATFNIVRIFLYAFMIVLIFQYLPKSDSGVFQGVSVFLGAIFTLGSTSVIGNMMAGMVITYMRSFKIGDRIKIGSVVGDVVEKSLFVIRIRTPKNEIVTVPNSTVLSTNVMNYSSTSSDEGLIINTTVTMGYEVPWRIVDELLIKAATKTNYLLLQPKPFVLQTALNDFTASYELCAYSKHPEKQAIIYSDLHRNILDIFGDAGIEMTVVYHQAIRDGNPQTSSTDESTSTLTDPISKVKDFIKKKPLADNEK